jgi:hypothetical protein
VGKELMGKSERQFWKVDVKVDVKSVKWRKKLM